MVLPSARADAFLALRPVIHSHLRLHTEAHAYHQASSPVLHFRQLLEILFCLKYSPPKIQQGANVSQKSYLELLTTTPKPSNFFDSIELWEH